MRRPLFVSATISARLAMVLLVFATVSCASREPATGTHPQISTSATPEPSVESPSPSPSSSPAVPATTPVPAPTAAGVPARLRGREFEVIPTSARVVALTFDAGANADGLPAILQTLANEHVAATFFLTGSFAARYPSSVRAIVSAGHRIANHSATHPYFTGQTDAQIRAELSRTYTQIISAGGTDPRPLFRFPYGDRNARTIAAVNSAGYIPVRWTVDTLGWKGISGGITAQTVINRAVGAARPGEIVLMHIGSNPDDHTTLDAQALPGIVSQLRAKGYGFTTLNALLS